MVTVVIILTTIIITYFSFQNSQLFDKLLLSPFKVLHNKQYYRIFTHIFLHANWEHLIFNMLSLYFMGVAVEQISNETFNSRFFYILLYISGGVFATLYSLIKSRNNINTRIVGASGSVSAIVFAFILYRPMNKLYLLGLPIGIPAVLFGLLYILASFYLMKKNNDSIAHDAHILGSVWGFIFPIILKPDLFQLFLSQILQ